MAQAQTYHGGCHCGRVRYDVAATLDRVISCNCSICQKSGALLAFAPEASFKLTSGEDALSDYQFRKKIIHHLFCKNCGVRSFARAIAPDGTPMVAINVRCLDDIDLSTIQPKHFDGRSL